MKSRNIYSLIAITFLAMQPLFAEDAVNLLAVKFDNFIGALPEGIQSGKDQEGLLKAELVEMPVKGKNVKVTKFVIDQAKYVDMRSACMKNLQMDKNYLLSFDLKIENLKMPDKNGIRFYIYSGTGKHAWIQVYGDGSTDGWLTAILPFSGKDLDANAGSVYFLVIFNSVTGTICFSDASVTELPEKTKMVPGFLTSEGASAGGQVLMLK